VPRADVQTHTRVRAHTIKTLTAHQKDADALLGILWPQVECRETWFCGRLSTMPS